MVIDQQGNKWYKVGLHAHTTLSDGHKTPLEVVARYRAEGYDAVALTDHWYFTPGEEQDGMLILSGGEYNLGHDTAEGVMHIVGFGMTRKPELTQESSYAQITREIAACGGIAVLAHPAWSVNSPADALALPEITFTEVYNAVSETHQSVRAYSEHFVEQCANAGIYYGLLATDDAHYYDGTDECKGWVMVRADELSREAILEALRTDNYYATQGPQLHVRREEDRFVVDCSPCSYVAAMSNAAWAANRVVRQENITHFEYDIRPGDRWVRIQVCDSAGKLAWSRVYPV